MFLEVSKVFNKVRINCTKIAFKTNSFNRLFKRSQAIFLMENLKPVCYTDLWPLLLIYPSSLILVYFSLHVILPVVQTSKRWSIKNIRFGIFVKSLIKLLSKKTTVRGIKQMNKRIHLSSYFNDNPVQHVSLQKHLYKPNFWIKIKLW